MIEAGCYASLLFERLTRLEPIGFGRALEYVELLPGRSNRMWSNLRRVITTIALSAHIGDKHEPRFQIYVFELFFWHFLHEDWVQLTSGLIIPVRFTQLLPLLDFGDHVLLQLLSGARALKDVRH